MTYLYKINKIFNERHIFLFDRLFLFHILKVVYLFKSGTMFLFIKVYLYNKLVIIYSEVVKCLTLSL